MTSVTEAQGQMSDLIALIPHPAEVLALVQRPAPPAGGRGPRSRRRAARRAIMADHLRGTEHVLAGLLP